MEIKDLMTEIQNEFLGTKWRGFLATEERLTEIVGHKCSCYDNGIDDGADGEDRYVMYASFNFEGIKLYARFYYGDVTEEIGYVDVSVS